MPASEAPTQTMGPSRRARRHRNRRRGGQGKGSQDNTPHTLNGECNDIPGEKRDRTRDSSFDTPSTAPPAYTSMLSPAPADTTGASLVLKQRSRAVSPTADSSVSFETSNSTGTKRRRARGGRKRRSKALIKSDQEFISEDAHMPGPQFTNGVDAEQKDVGEELYGTGDWAEEMQGIHWSINGQAETEQENGVDDAPQIEQKPDCKESQNEKSAEASDLTTTQPAIKKPFDTGVRAFSIRKASQPQEPHPPISIEAVEPSADGDSARKSKKSKKKEKQKNKQQVAEDDNGQASVSPGEPNETKGEASGKPVTEERPPTDREVRIKLDLNLEVEVLVRAKIKGEVMITFL